MNYYLGVDIGTSSVKSLLMDATETLPVPRRSDMIL